MQQDIKAYQESLLSTSNSSFSTGDLLLLSHNLGFQAQKASNHLRKPMVSSPDPKLLLTATAQREDADVSKSPWFAPSSNAAVSSANSLHWGSSMALKESSESLITAHEGSSQALSELDQSKGGSVFFHRTPSFSCNESSECYESGAETTTIINMNGESLHFSKSKEVDDWTTHRRESNVHTGVTAENMEAWDCGPLKTLNNTAPTDIRVGVHHNVSTENMVASRHKGPFANRVPSGHRASSSKLEALDLLIYAAIQVGFLDDEDDQQCDVCLQHPKRSDRGRKLCHDRYKDGFPIRLSSPILKKKVVRRARSAFSKRTGSNMLQRLGIASPAKNLERKLSNVEKKVKTDIHKGAISINKPKADHTQQETKAIQYAQRNPSNVSSERILACDLDLYKVLISKNGDMSKQEVLQALPTKASDVCNTYLKGVQVKNRQCKTLMRQQKLHGLPTPELCGSLSKPFQSALETELCENLCEVEYVRGQKNHILEEDSREAISEGEAQHPMQPKSGGSLTMPSQVLHEADVLERCQHVFESQTVSKRSKRLHVLEHERSANVPMQPIDMMLRDSFNSLDTRARDVNSSNRSKRSRSQVLPTKFSDSVLQPWKRAYKKK